MAVCLEHRRGQHAENAHSLRTAHTPACYRGPAKEAQWCMCSLRQRGRGGGGRQFLPAGSFLTSGIIVPAKRTCNIAAHLKEIKTATHTLWHNFSPSPKTTQTFSQFRHWTILFVDYFLCYSPQSLSSINSNRPVVGWCCCERPTHQGFKMINREEAHSESKAC